VVPQALPVPTSTTVMKGRSFKKPMAALEEISRKNKVEIWK
jgi:hypothetical protein